MSSSSTTPSTPTHHRAQRVRRHGDGPSRDSRLPNGRQRRATPGLRHQRLVLLYGSGILNGFFPGAVFTANYLAGGSASRYPAGNLPGFDDRCAQHRGGRLHRARGQPAEARAPDGGDIGVDYPALEARVATVGAGINPWPAPADRAGAALEPLHHDRRTLQRNRRPNLSRNTVCTTVTRVSRRGSVRARIGGSGRRSAHGIRPAWRDRRGAAASTARSRASSGEDSYPHRMVHAYTEFSSRKPARTSWRCSIACCSANTTRPRRSIGHCRRIRDRRGAADRDPPEHRALATEEVPGRPFAALLADKSVSGQELVAIARRIGRWARRQQLVPAEGVRWRSGARISISACSPEGLRARRLRARRRLDLFDALCREIGSTSDRRRSTPTCPRTSSSTRPAASPSSISRWRRPARRIDLSHVTHLELLAARESPAAREMARRGSSGRCSTAIARG